MTGGLSIFQNGAITIVQTPVMSGSTPQYGGQFQDGSGNGIPLSSIAAAKLTICDTTTRQIINGVQGVNILNSGRGTVDANGNLTLNLQAADTVKLRQTIQETRSLIIEWDYAGSFVGKHEVQFPIVQSAPG